MLDPDQRVRITPRDRIWGRSSAVISRTNSSRNRVGSLGRALVTHRMIQSKAGWPPKSLVNAKRPSRNGHSERKK